MTSRSGWRLAAMAGMLMALAALLAGCVGSADLGSAPKAVFSVTFDESTLPDCNNDGLCVSTDASLAWTLDSSTFASSPYSVRSAPIGDNGRSCLTVDLTVPGLTSHVVQFSYKTSTESGFDFLWLEVDGVQVAYASGDIDWSSYRYETGSKAQHTYEWCYEKDGSASDGADAVWVDNIAIY